MLKDKKMSERFELFGEWYLPEHEQLRSSGKLTFEPYVGIGLTLYANKWAHITQTVTFIYGVTEDGEEVCLGDCLCDQLLSNGEAHFKAGYLLGGHPYETAVYWYRKAAEQGEMEAQCHLGNCYEYGRGITQNYENAVYWYRQSIEKGNATAQWHLGLCYRFGHGVKLDYAQSFYWF